MNNDPSTKEIETTLQKIKQDAESGGYRLNPDTAFTYDLIKGLLINENRYGYQSCPCRLAAGDKALDLDIICPCDYRDADLTEFNSCYCSLYVSEFAVKNQIELTSIPERRPPKEKRLQKEASLNAFSALKYPVWRCNVCGYLCARDSAPEICPICKAGKDRFEKFI